MTNLLIAVILITGFILVSFLPAKWKLWTVGLVSIFQLHLILVGSFNPSLSLVLSLSLWPTFIIGPKRALQRVPVMMILGLILVQILSTLWSIDKINGLQTIASLISFLILLVVAYRIEVCLPGTVRHILVALLTAMTIEAILVILFRLSPSVENAFWRTPLAGIIIEPDTLRLLLSGLLKNNILDPTKAGGLFINANVAAVYLGMGSFFAWGLAEIGKARWLQLVGGLLWLAVFFTGSKVGLMLGIGLPVLGWLMSLQARIGWRSWLMGFVAVGIMAMIMFVLMYSFIDVGQSGMINRLDSALSIRFKIWNYGWQAFLQSPFLGQGFGGWQLGYVPYAYSIGIPTNFPPHNTLIYLWSQSGLFALAIGIGFMLSVVGFAYRLHLLPSKPLSAWGRMFGLASLWLFIQGFGENYGPVGENHILVLFALALGFSLARYDVLGRQPHGY